jgi:hypothetical protein
MVTVDLPWPLRVRTCLLDRGFENGRLRRNLAVAVPFGEGPFTTRFADLRHRAVKVGGLLS